MELNKLVFGGLALGCLAAAASGGYLAARQGTPAPQAIAAPSAPAPAEVPSAATPASGKAVAESEGVIAPEVPVAAAPAPVELEAPAATTARRQPAPQPTRTAAIPERSAPAPARRSTPPRNDPSPTRAPAESSVPAPTTSNAPAPNGGTMWEMRPAVEPERVPVNAEPEPPAPPPPPAAPEMVDLVVPSDAVLGLQIEKTITSETARVEDRVEARVTRDVRVGDRVAIPAGSIVQGSVMEVERGGKIKEKARLGIRFHTVIIDGSRLAIKTDAVMREGSSPAGESAAKIGGAAVGGAILGAILGGSRGAVIGGAAGAAGGTAAQAAGQRNAAVLPAGTTVSVRMQQPVTVTVEK